jgi:hypothetical protein
VSDEILLPQYMIGGSTGGAAPNRLQYVCRLKLTGLSGNSTYRYFTGASTTSNITTATSPGNFFVINNSSGADGYITGESSSKAMNGSLMSNDEFTTSSRYGEFTTDGAGRYTGWFSVVATGNAVFNTGNALYFYVQLNNGAGGTTTAQSYRTTSTITIIDYGNTNGSSSQGTAVIGKSFSGAEDLILLYDNTSGTGRPLYITWTEDDEITTNYTTWYNTVGGTGVDGYPGRWGAIIPNNLSNGIGRIERRANDNSVVASNTSSDGTWGSVNTVNAGSGITPIVLDSTNAPLPVEITYFNSSVSSNSAALRWATSQEINNSGFEVQRSNDNSLWNAVSFIKGNGTTNQPQFYQCTDKNLGSGKYFYRLKQIDFNGNFEFFNLNSTVIIGTPEKYEVMQNYPNPFNPVTQISYSLPENSYVQLRIYDASGKLVNELINSNIEKGYYIAEFNASNIASGIYFYQLIAKDNLNNKQFTKIMKMVLVK